MKHSSQREPITTSIAIISIIAALALLGALPVTLVTTIIPQEVEANGCILNPGGGGAIALNASLGRCVFVPK